MTDIVINPPRRTPPVEVEASSPAQVSAITGRGRPGEPGIGVPAGGTAGQALVKASAADYATEWADIAAGGSVAWDDVTGKPTFFSGAYGDLTDIPSTFTPSAHNQAWATITATPTTLAGYGISDAATAAQGALAASASQPGHTHAQSDVTGLVSDLAGKAATVHTHVIADTTGLQAALDGKQPLATVLTNTTAAFTTAQETKLAGIAAGATVNSADATLLARANHTGTQLAATISDFATAVAATAAVTANTAKVSNATHTGDVTGATALTIAAGAVTLSKMANLATSTILGRVTAGTGVPEALTAAQVRTLLNVADGATANASDASLRDRTTHTGAQAIATVTGLQTALDGKQPLATVLTNTTAAFTTAQETKLAGIATAATANATDAALRDRATHTGTQLASTVSDFTASARAQVEATLLAGTNITLTPAGSGATRTITIDAAGGGAGTNLTYTAATRVIASDTGTDATLPLVTSGDAGLAPASGGGTTNFLRADGTWAAPSGGGSSDPLDLTVTNPAAPAAGTVTVFRRSIAQRQMPAFVGPSGLDSALQPFMARNKVGYWCPPGGATTVPGVLGMGAFTVTGFTAQSRAIAATSMFTRMRRLGYQTAATAGTVGHFRQGVNMISVGDGGILGGFHYVVRFGISDAAEVSGARMFMGLRISASPTNVEPNTLTNCVGIGHGAADTNFRIFYGGSTAQTPINLGANFPANTRSEDVYELALFSAPSSPDVNWEVTRLNTGHVAAGTITNSGATILPPASSLMTPWGYRTNNATALAVAMDVMSVYLETDY